MKCIECGHELKDGAIFCIRCGAMQVSMDGKPIERGKDWPTVESQAGESGFRSSTDGALHSAQSKNPRGFKPGPKRNGGRIAIVVIVIIALVAAIAFAVTRCSAPASSGGESGTGTIAASLESASSTSSASSAAASTSASSASASAASASAASGSAASAATGDQDAAQQTAPAETQQPAQPEPAPAPAPEPAPAPAPEPAPAPAPEPVYNDYYVLPDSSSYYYSYGELSGMSAYDLYIARNEIYARHGRMFNRQDLQDYFNSQAWYEPVYTAAQFDGMGQQLSDVELQNAKLMKQVEADKGSPYL